LRERFCVWGKALFYCPKTRSPKKVHREIVKGGKEIAMIAKRKKRRESHDENHKEP